MKNDDVWRPTIELRTAILLAILLCGGYFAWERYTGASVLASLSSTPAVPAQIGATVVPPQIGTKAANPTIRYTDVVRYMTADGKFGITDDQSKVPAGAKILSLEQREIQTEQGTVGAPNEARNGTATRLSDYRRNQLRSGRALLAQLEQEQAAQKQQRDAEDAEPSSSPSSSDSGRPPCRPSSGSPHAVFCDPSRSRSVDDVSIHP